MRQNPHQYRANGGNHAPKMSIEFAVLRKSDYGTMPVLPASLAHFLLWLIRLFIIQLKVY